jgi:hypothetical protein
MINYVLSLFHQTNYYYYPVIKGSNGKLPEINGVQLTYDDATNNSQTLEEWFKPLKNGELPYDLGINLKKSNMLVIILHGNDKKSMQNGNSLLHMRMTLV